VTSYGAFNHIVDINRYQLSVGAEEAARARIAAIYERKGDNFGNAREMRTLFEDVVQAQANRLASQPDIAPEQLQVFESTDIGYPMGNLRLVPTVGMAKSRLRLTKSFMKAVGVREIL
jgi:hypothetical protein